MMDTISGVEKKRMEEKRTSLHRMSSKMAVKAHSVFLEKGWLFYIIAFLLSRAVILSVVSPFTIAFLATIWFMQRDKAAKTIIAMLAGGLSLSVSQGVYVGLSMLSFLFLAGLCKHMKKLQFYIPFLVFAAIAVARICTYSFTGKLTSYEWMLLSVEGVLGMLLVLIFMQSVPLISPKRYKPTLKNEEIVCIIILIASILTGMIGWEIYGASIEQVFSRYFVLVLAYIGGAAIGSTVGVVAGLILSLANVVNIYQMSLLAFSGLLGGLLKEGKKAGVAVGLLAGTLLISIYGGTEGLAASFAESIAAAAMFLLTPAKWFHKLAKYIPGTEENANEQEQYLQKVRNVTAKRVEQFSDVFEALSKSFMTADSPDLEENEARKETDYFLSRVAEKTCQNCFMKERCWQQQFDKTYSLLENIKDDLVANKPPNHFTYKDFASHCVKSKKVLDKMTEEASYLEANRKLKQQVLESKRLVAEQLQGVSEVMDDFASEILKEREHHEKQEMQIIHALDHMGLELEKLDIFRLEKGNVDIEMSLSFYDYHGEGPKLIAPVLTEILHELIVVKYEEISPFPNGYSFLKFGSAKEFVVQTGIANAAKGGGLISGDSYTTMELGEGKYAMAISDGMGNGSRANEESRETLRLLQQILQTGIPEKVAIKSINSILSLRTTDEMFATLDLAMINLHNAHARFLKIGTAPSYVKRGDRLFEIEASNLPMGIIREFEVDIVNEQLMSGDILIMMSDGIFEGPKHVENTDIWIKRKLREIKTNDPQEIADLLLEEVVRTQSGAIEDDMTVLVAKVEKHIPQWSAIDIPS
ncbi:stage II sporulation protein E [Virgibacillus halophilus]|uniref:stage II sporulation protein E n=1 Tax=Tigheibacillus halophilus TaxID=361280 RepID=UPI0036348BD1